MKKINFILPANYDKPIGAFKIFYQYANELARRGHEVTISYLFRMDTRGEKQLFTKLQRFVNNHIYRLAKHEEKVTWIKLEENIKLNFDVVSPDEIPDGDCVFTTISKTSFFVSNFPERIGKKFYLIQNIENWLLSDDELRSTYSMGMTNIAISHEISDYVEKLTGTKPLYLPNFYDPKEFFVENPIESRENVVCILQHYNEFKRTKFGLEVLHEVKKEIPDLRVELFGASKPEFALEDYVHFTFKATADQLRRDIYGKSKVHLLPSTREGWVLIGMESMASGTPMVASDIGGVADFTDNTNSVLVDPQDKQAYVDALVKLLKDDDLRIKLAQKAVDDVQQYRVERSTDILEGYIIK